MSAKSSMFTGVALGALLSATAWYGADRVEFPDWIKAVEASAPAAEVPPPSVDVVAAELRTITEWDEYPGRFEAVERVDIRARVSGHLDEVHFTAGEIVEEGDLLFTIDKRPFVTELAEAKAILNQARASEKIARRNLERAQKLVKRGHVTEATLDERVQEVEHYKGAVATARAAVERANLNLSFTEIRSPVTGRISEDFISVGNLINSGAQSDALTTIVSLDPIHFVFDATEQQYLQYVRANGNGDVHDSVATTQAAIKLIDEPTYSHAGKIDFIDNQLDRATGTIRGRAVLDNEDLVLTPGMFGRMRLAVATDVERVVVPEHAIGSDQTTKFVMVVTEDGVVERRSVILRDSHDGQRVVDGITAGEHVIVTGLHMVAPGATVTANVINDTPIQIAKR